MNVEYFVDVSDDDMGNAVRAIIGHEIGEGVAERMECRDGTFRTLRLVSYQQMQELIQEACETATGIQVFVKVDDSKPVPASVNQTIYIQLPSTLVVYNWTKPDFRQFHLMSRGAITFSSSSG